jgi:hypothetical protein
MNSALNAPQLTLAHRQAVVELLLQVPDFDLPPEQLVQFITPLYLHPEIPDDLRLPIIRLLIDKHVYSLPSELITDCVHRWSREPVTGVLLASVDLSTWLTTFTQQLLSADETVREQTKKMLPDLPLFVLIGLAVSLVPSQLCSDLMHPTVAKINSTTPSMDPKLLVMQLQKLPLVTLMRFYHANSTALADKREAFLGVMKEKMVTAPVRGNQLICAGGPIPLPPELQKIETTPAAMASKLALITKQ